MNYFKFKSSVLLLAIAGGTFLGAAANAAEPVAMLRLGLPMAATQGNQMVAPNFTNPGSGSLTGYGYSSGFGFGYVKGLRAAGLTEFLKAKSVQAKSAPNAAGNVTRTQTCSTEFRNPITGIVRYTSPTQSITSSPMPASQFMSTSGGCDAGAMKQAGNPLGLGVELASISSYSVGMNSSVKLRVVNPSTHVVLWSVTLLSTASLGSPIFFEMVDVNNDGTDEIVVAYYKDTTPVGFSGQKTQYTNQVRNGVTGVVLGQYSWVDTIIR